MAWSRTYAFSSSRLWIFEISHPRSPTSGLAMTGNERSQELKNDSTSPSLKGYMIQDGGFAFTKKSSGLNARISQGEEKKVPGFKGIPNPHAYNRDIEHIHRPIFPRAEAYAKASPP
jgi:hypothetical protein